MKALRLLALLGWAFMCQSCARTGATPAMPNVSIAPGYSSEALDRVALYVQNATNTRLAPGVLREMEDEFMRVLIAKGYILAARSDIDQVLKEQRLQVSGITESANAESALARAAKVMNVSAVILVSLNSLETRPYQPVLSSGNRRYYLASASISARLIQAERARILWVSSYSGEVEVSDQRAGAEAVPVIAGVVARGIPSRSP